MTSFLLNAFSLQMLDTFPANVRIREVETFTMIAVRQIRACIILHISDFVKRLSR